MHKYYQPFGSENVYKIPYLITIFKWLHEIEYASKKCNWCQSKLNHMQECNIKTNTIIYTYFSSLELKRLKNITIMITMKKKKKIL